MAAVDTETDPGAADERRVRRWGWLLLLAGMIAFLAWALSASLDAGVAAPGTVAVAGSRKAVQSLGSGKVLQILVGDGDEVQAGQVLLRLDDTGARASFDATQVQWWAGMAAQARLAAEQQGRRPDFAALRLALGADPRALAAIEQQRGLAEARAAALANELSALAASGAALEAQAQGLEASRLAKQEQLRLLREPLAGLRELAAGGHLARNRVLEQERSIAALEGGVAEDLAGLARQRQSIAELQARIAQRQAEARKEAAAALADTQRELVTLQGRLQALQFDLDNLAIRAPARGLVLNLAVHAVGGVVAAGAPLMEIFPLGEALRVEAQIPQHLIDKVRPGLEVDILFPALNQARTPRVAGRLTSVSADVLVDAASSTRYFKALVEVTRDGLVQLGGQQIRAGMPAEVFIRTGERSPMSYLLKPLLDRLQRALSEP